MANSVEELLAASNNAMARSDARAIAALFHPKANFPTPAGDFAIGRAAMISHLETAFAAIPEDIEHQTIREHIHLVTADLAVVDTVGENYRRAATGDRELVSAEGFTLVAVREAGEWVWAGMRGALVPKR